MKPFPAIPRGIWMLGFVSLFMDVPSELIHGLLPVYMVTSLGASAFAVGIVEGIAESTALIVKVFSGALSDYLGKHKALAVIGYGLGALSKPLFALALTVNWVFAARFMDRIGKGIRGAPRDALIADLVLAGAQGLTAVGLGAALWGLHLGMTQGLLATMVAATAPAYLRSTAFGFFNRASGIAMLFASVLAGVFWDRLGPGATFYAGAVFALAALLMLALRSRPSAAL